MKKILCSILALLVIVSCQIPAFANGGDGHRGAALHFVHPIIVDSPSPDTKVRLDYFYRSVEEGDEKGTGSNHIWEVEPFFSLGYKTGKVELITFLIFGIPFNQDEGEEVETEFSYQVSGLYHVHPRVRALLELDGTTVLSGHEEGDNVVNLSPGILLQPLSDPNLVLGLGASFPVSGLQEFDWGLNTSVFYHF